VSGVANTAVGALAIYTQMRLHISPALANLLGHATGLLFSCFNARNDVFRF
jgi:putative flippase GtrA